MSHGAAMRIIGPADLRKRIAVGLRAAADAYSDEKRGRA
ncbi:hypothetical protein [Uliginosibacterium flavum]|uniref:WYL domain-containing protein n=1 Tax=Uliginosibacterium flavum TaxID=1396831 RepID=A0ABV2TR51_9RHOO